MRRKTSGTLDQKKNQTKNKRKEPVLLEGGDIFVCLNLGNFQGAKFFLKRYFSVLYRSLSVEENKNEKSPK